MTERLKEFYIQNPDNYDKTITLQEEDPCSSISGIVGGEQPLPANSEVKVVFPRDGVYDVFVDGIFDGRAYYFKSLFESMILFISESLCGETGTNCIAVEQCATESGNVLNSAISKEILYVASNAGNAKDYGAGCNQALLNMRCSARKAAEFISDQENIIGVSNPEELLKIEIAEIYLQLYKTDEPGMNSSETLNEVKEMYDYDNVIQCIKPLGVLEGTEASAPCGIPHTATIKAVPNYISRGVLTSIAVTYNLNPKGDEFIRIVSNNIGLTDTSTFNGVDHTVAMNTSNDITYFIEYEYKRGNDTDIKRIQVFVDAIEPQWFGGESTTTDFIAGGTVNEANLIFDNGGVKKYQSSSNTTTYNTNTQGKYIWWITRNQVDFDPGIGKIPVGNFVGTDCSIGAPSTYAIVWKQGTVILTDGTPVTYNFYRTCPLQDLVDQTLQYKVTQK